MSDMQKYIDICNENADMKAQALRGLANIIGREADQVDGDTQDLLRLCKDSIKKAATDMQNLVRTMGEQLAIERAEAERMKRLYEMARMDIQDLKTDVKLFSSAVALAVRPSLGATTHARQRGFIPVVLSW